MKISSICCTAGYALQRAACLMASPTLYNLFFCNTACTVGSKIPTLPLEGTTQWSYRTYSHQPFNIGIKSLHAMLPDKIFYWGFCFLIREFH
jgi:hypothetical protein